MQNTQIKFLDDGIELTEEHNDDCLSFYLNKDKHIEIAVKNVGKIRNRESLEAVIVFLKSNLEKINK